MPLRISSIWTTRLRHISGSTARPRPRTVPLSRFAAIARPHARYESTVGASPPVGELQSTYERNRMFREAFREQSPEIGAAVEKKLGSPYVPNARTYPSSKATAKSLARSKSAARRQVAFDTIADHYWRWVPQWQQTLKSLKSMTAENIEGPKMTAFRIILPKSWDLSLSNQKVEFLDSSTGLMSKLRMSADQKNPSAIILRGQRSVLAGAAQDLLAACKDIEIFELGDLEVFDYEVKRLWPVIKDAPDGGSSVPADLPNSIWAHKEHSTYWIDTAYEDTPRPETWTVESFETYVTTLVCGRLRRDLAMKHYGPGGERPTPKTVDTDGIRVRLIAEAFEDPSAAPFITPAALKMALEFMSQRGGHRAAADRLFTLAEKLGMPMDTDAFNIILHGYVTIRDVTMFHRFLLKTKSRYFCPNARTWLLFLELVRNDSVRRQIIVAMYEAGMFEDPATRRGIAKIMASHDAYMAFKSDRSLDAFMAEMAERYGKGWLTSEAKTAILREFFMFHQSGDDRFDDFKLLVEHQAADGRNVGIENLNLVLQTASTRRDWRTALWALEQFGEPGSNLEPDSTTYLHVINLAIWSHCPHALGLAFFYAVHHRKLWYNSRLRVGRMLMRQHSDPWWGQWDRQPPVFSNSMASRLYNQPISGPQLAVSAAEWAILCETKGAVPEDSLAKALETAWRTMDRPMWKQQSDGSYARVKNVMVKMVNRVQQSEGQITTKSIVRLTKRFNSATMIASTTEESGADVPSLNKDGVADVDRDSPP